MNPTTSGLLPTSAVPASRFAVRKAPKPRPSADSRAAYLVLLTKAEGVRALLFNADRRYLTEVIDDPITVDLLCSAGRRCDPPMHIPEAEATDVLCFALGGC